MLTNTAVILHRFHSNVETCNIFSYSDMFLYLGHRWRQRFFIITIFTVLSYYTRTYREVNGLERSPYSPEICFSLCTYIYLHESEIRKVVVISHMIK